VLRAGKLEHHPIVSGNRATEVTPGAILVAIGANLPGPDGERPIETCRAAVAALDALPRLRVRGLSRWYRTAPMPPSGQPDYINGVAHLSGTIDPGDLLAALQAIEAQAGRTRGAPNAARTLDLDIIAMGDLIRAAPDPILPHPRAHQRQFVLMPLAEVAPGWVHPILGETVAALIASLSVQGVRVEAAP
jgi:2-amino-4-hydroxy-6-hydroxymethyldihydropteridine diphosphokinase